MRHLARLFSALCLLALLAAAALLYLQASRPPDLIEAPLTGPIERILVEKSARRITLYQDGIAVRVWPMALGFAPEGDKTREGDGRTPEGLFTINRRNDRSAFHLSLGLDYPQKDDIARARKGGYSPGGDIMIHGQPNAVREPFTVPGDWTAGCIAITNAQMREIWDHIPIGTKVEIRP
ncbi:L,D-transpeptidase family protein [Xinfangfangia sp. CPCC 101601]|uniref:L,D-transpeptidase family protein n=1 Tax=Pseudogemmobacter lacusdianii TaxID=3069608 RepID=A0ABU0VXU4_9RHOB|nr:L,D-transpeptidase family protein [Xinfangfangia sp. CPCC 101601]MDQ2066443.1 L,D-transpeptidase family protein [Xinfangfangia sp. CPCC 101601]